MQHTLTFLKDKIKYVSKPFDFEAMCIINDAHNDEIRKVRSAFAEMHLTICLRYGRNSGYYRFR